METISHDTVSTLNDLIECCKDGEYGFRTGAEHVEDAALKQFFMQRGSECSAAASELQSLVVQHGGTPDDGGSAAGALHRGWMAVKGTLSGRSELAMLEEAERAEDGALAAYREALRQDLPQSVRPVVERQCLGVQRNHDQVRSLRDQARAAKG